MTKTNITIMEGKKIALVFLFLFMFSLNFIAAEKVTIQVLEQGLDIVYPELFVYPQDENISALIWASNSSNGLTLNNETGYCIFSLTNNIGELIYRNNNMSYDGQDFEVGDIPCEYCFHDKVLSGNFTMNGFYTARYNCKSYDDTAAGVVSKQFTITKNGQEPDTSKAIIQIGFIFLLFGIAFLFLWLTFKLEQPGLKIFFLFLSFILLMSCLIFLYIAGVETSVYEIFNNSIIKMIYIFGIILIVIFAYLMIEQTKAAITSMQENKGYEVDF